MKDRDKKRNIRLDISYVGTNYHGWQRQKGQITVQETVESALETLTQEKISLIGSGRTDAGVHALCQTANFLTKASIPTDGFKKGLNSLLPEDVAIINVSEVSAGFHARKSALSKTYRYIIVTSQQRLPLVQDRAWIIREPLDVEAMARAAKILIGKHDFSSFMASGSSVKSTVRTITALKVKRGVCQQYLPLEYEEIQVEVTANGFLKYMVRNICGLLKEVGLGKLPWKEAQRILDARDRGVAPPTAPPCGLYLVGVDYV